MKRLGLFALAFVFSLTATPLFASEQWLVVKDKAGACKIMKTKKGTPTIVGGPYSDKEAAQRALSDLCPGTTDKTQEKK